VNIFTGNLSYDLTESAMRELFEEFGEVTSAKIITDRDTGRSKGFGFVEMSDKTAAMEAIEQLNGKDMGGRALVVNEARPREERPKRRPRY
jgi:RNA recognition motif-containing protein